MDLFRNNVLFYPANIIDYGRIICLIISLYFYNDSGLLTIIFYAMSQLLDCLDGYAARLLKQESSFGAVLDMITDRFSSAAFCLCLSHSYPKYYLFFCLFIILDFGSHWIQMYSTLLLGEKHHKKAESKFRIMRIYYDSKFVLFGMCFGSEMFLVNMYIRSHIELLGFSPLQQLINQGLLLFVSAPIFAMKQVISIICLVSAVERMIKFDQKKKLKQIE